MSSNNAEKNILYGGPDAPLLDSDAKSLGDIALKKLAENGDLVIFIDGLSGKTLTASQIRGQIIRLAGCLRYEGINEGDVIGLCCENRAELLLTVMAGILLGATVAPLNVTYIERELNHALNLSKPKIILTSSYAAAKVVACAAKNKFIKKVIHFDKPKKDIEMHVTTFSRFIGNRQIPPTYDKFDCRPVNMAENVVLILCSSGTTGLPKGVQLTQANLLTACSQLDQGIQIMKQIVESITTLSVIPWFHAYGLLTMIGFTICGATLVTLPKYEDSLFLNTIEKYKVDALFGVPPLLVMLSKSPLVDKYDLSSLKIIYSGAAPLSAEVSDAVKERIPVMGIFQGFGMSEMTLSVLQQSMESCSPGSVGKLRPGSWGKIINPDTGAILGPNERGELCFKGTSIMKGYIGDQAATSNTIDTDGWLHTGDIGYFDENEEWYVVDRLKELIKYKGYQVPPAEIEAILLTHPEINDAGVIGVPDISVGEKPMGFVVKKTNSKLTEAQIIDFVADKMSYAKRLHGGVMFIQNIPKNVTGKILRRELRDLATSNKSLKSKL